MPQPVLEHGRICAGPDSSRRPRIAFAFPGQGSRYAGMLNTLVQESPAAAAHLQDLNATLSRLRLPTFDRLIGEDSHKLGTDLFETQLSVLLADLLMFRVLESQGIEADVLTGHSYGEYAALVAGGAWELEQAIEMTRARCAAIASCGVQGGMLATGMPADRLQELLQESEWSRRVFLANHNAPDQTIVAGSTEALREFAERLRTAGHASRLLAVPAPFHTPLMAPVRDMLHATASGCSFRPPNRPLLSSVTNRYTTEPEELRNNLVEQQVRPVHYVDLVRRLIADGVDVLIEVGPRQVLTGLHRQIAGDSPVGIIATDDPRRPGIQQLNSVRKLLDSRGCTVATRPTSSRPASDGGGTEAIVHFDATARRRERNRRAGLAEDTAAATFASGETAASAVDADLAGVLVQFVCEQTGYPPEVVSLDAELEADLGIDSIKKAQLLGELRDHFPIRATHALKLDDFPTLRHILNFLSASRSGEPAGVAHAADEGPDDLIARVANGSATAAPPLTTAVSSAPRTVPPVIGVVPDALAILNVQRFRGSPYNIGFQHGRASAEAIRRTLQKYVDLLGQRLFELQPLQSALDQREIYFGADGMDELRGMADAVGIPVEHLASFNLGLSMEFLPGCTQFAVTARANGDAGLIHAVNEDWMLALALPGILKRMAQVRFPDGGIPFLTFSTCGELAGQNGINARGLAVSSTLLLDRLPRDDYTPGRVHPALVKEVLERADGIDAALDIIRRMPRSGAWSMCLSEHAADRLCYVEYDRESVEVRMADDSVESTNHCLIKSARGETPAQSCQRLDRLHELLDGRNGRPSRVTLAEAQAILRDRYDRSLGRVTLHPTKSTIRRPYTQASIVMRPTLGEVWVTADSVQDEVPDQFHLLKLGKLFRDEERAEVSPREPIATADPGIDDAQSCRAVPDRVMNRFVLRMVDAPLNEHQQRERPAAGRVLLVGDNPTTESLRQQLSGSGAEVVSLPLSGDLDETLQELDQVWEASPAATLILATGRDPDAGCGLDEDVWKQRRARGVMTPHFVCQRWLQHVARTRLSETPRLVAVTALGGDFGLSGGSAAVEGGALTGLLKGLGQEFDQLCVKIIDAPSGDPPALVARCLLQELDSAAPEVEVGYVCGRRRIVQSAPRPLFVIDKPTLPSGTWVITGGGRGVTAIVARELGRRFGLTMQLLGSSPPPDIPNDWRGLTADRRRELRAGIARTARESGGDPAAAWRDVERQIELDASLRAFADAGVDVTYRQCDVTNRSELAQVLAAIRVEAGPIRGVIHGAGVEASCRFDRKTRENVDRTVAVKVDAAFSLATLTRDDPVEFFVGFGSISGRLGGVGQSDYSMSSDLLAKLFCRLRAERPACRAVTLHWPPWGDTGMAMRPESKLALEIAGHAFMPAAEGAAHLGDELAAGANEAEVMLIDWPTTRIGREAPLSPAEAQAYWQRTPAVATAPLLSGIVRLEDRRRLIAEMDLDPQRDPCLVHHQLDGVPILPLVAALEAFAEAVPLLTPGATVRAFRDVRIHEGLRFLSGTNQTARVEARCERGVIVCELQSDFRNRRGFVQAPSRRHVSAEVDLSPSAPAATIALAQADGKWGEMQYEPSDANAPSMAIRHGPPLRCLKQVRIQDDRLWGRMIAGSGTELCPSPHRTAWKLPSAVLDACLLACSVLTYVREKALHLPSGLDVLRFGDPPANNEPCQVAVQLRETIGSRAVYDFTLYGADGRVILDAQGYQATYLTAAATTS
ncbi:MAG: C45 family autoproteolytic acyltransferase/hydrolase [Planctomycetaceae bacterium]